MLDHEKFIDTVAFILGTIGRALAFVGMALFCAFVWYVVLQII